MRLKMLQGSRVGGEEKAVDMVDPWASRSCWIDDRFQAGETRRVPPRGTKSW